MYKNDYSLQRGPTRRTWLAAGAALAAVLVLLVLIAVACNARSPKGAPDAPGSSPAPASAGEDDSDAGGSVGLGSGDNGSGDSGTGDTENTNNNDTDNNDGDGDGDGDGDTDPVEPSAEDCVSFDPANLTVEPAGDAWRLMDGGHAMKLFDTQLDAEDGLKVARNWTRSCFIGRDNDREDRYRYIVHYWQEPSGLPLGLAPSSFDCVSYDPKNLEVSPAVTGDDLWVLRDGGLVITTLASQADAERARIVAGGFSQKCVIGGDNTREDHYRYTMDYWRQ